MEAAATRLGALARHLEAAQVSEGGDLERRACSVGDSAAYERRPPSLDDVVVVDAIRTPITKARRGGLKDTPADELVGVVLKGILQRTGVNPKEVGDMVFGSVLGDSSQRAIQCRIAMFMAGFPETVPVHTVNRQCSSGLQAIASVAAAIQAGHYSIGVAGGVETMSANPMKWEGGTSRGIDSSRQARDCLLPMGITSENVAAKFGVSREVQDAFAAQSHRKVVGKNLRSHFAVRTAKRLGLLEAAAARASGRFRDETVAVTTSWKDPKTGEEKQVVVEEDDGIRPQASASSLAKLPAVFKKDGSTTAGNSSQVSDGAAAVLLMTRREAAARGMPVLGVFRSFAAAGVDPAIMGIGPQVAIPLAVEKAGLRLQDIDVFEINEAFASQASYCVKALDIPPQLVNPNGGAIAFGHPLGCTGARMTATLLHEMRRRGRAARFGVVSMCIGSGMGAAAVFERGDVADGIANARPITNAAHGLSADALV